MKRNKLALYIGTFLLFCLSFCVLEYPKIRKFNDGLLHIYFLDVGQGDAELIKTPNKKLILIDAGPKSSVSDVISGELPFNINKIDLVIISHSHADHINGMLDVLTNYEVGCVVYDAQDSSNTEAETELRNELKRLEINVIPTSDLNNSPDCFSDSSIKLDIYSLRNIQKLDAEDLENDQNLESNIVLLKYNSFETLFTGDAEIEVQEELTPLINENIEVLKAAHHGSFNGFYAPLIDKLDPDFAVISAGQDNRYGHPDQETLQQYAEKGLKYARTDEDGTVEISSDGYRWYRNSAQ